MSDRPPDEENAGIEQKVEWYERTCRGCEEPMEDMSWREFCNDCLDEAIEQTGDRAPEDTEEAKQVLRDALGVDTDE